MENPSTEYYACWSVDDRRIVFASDRSGKSQLYTMGPLGGGIVRVTNNEFSDFHPKWSPDATSVVYEVHAIGGHNPEVFMHDLQTNKTRQFTKHESSDSMPSVSYDNRMVAFISDRTGKFEIYMLDLKTEKLHQVTDHGFTIYHPQFLPEINV